MQKRRKAEAPAAAPSSSGAAAPVRSTPMHRPQQRRSSSSSSTPVLLGIIIILVALISILSPATVANTEEQVALGAQNVYDSAKKAELELEDLLAGGGEQQPPVPDENGGSKDHSDTIDASERMWRQPNNWVKGEKNLKKALQELVLLQKAGDELGVPILTRWLGDDFPVWPKKGSPYEDKATWETERTRRYAVMQKDETEWRDKVRAEYFSKADPSFNMIEEKK